MAPNWRHARGARLGALASGRVPLAMPRMRDLSSPPRISVIGSANIDHVARCERLPRPGETVTDAEFARVPGGKGANQAVAAARLGARVRFVGKIGSDSFTVEAVEREGVDVSFVTRDDDESGVALILVESDGENVIVVAPGANRRLTAEEVVASFADDDPDAVICQQEIPLEAVVAAADAANTRGALFCLNAAPARGALEQRLRPNLLVVNDYEYEATGDYSGLIALTLGVEGAVLLEGGREVARARPPHVEAVDGTAAGDAFCAALVVSLLEGHQRENALARACAAGALAASRPGAQSSLPTIEELEAVLAA
jgi:ribokinase